MLLPFLPTKHFPYIDKFNKRIYDAIGDPISDLCIFQRTSAQYSHNSTCFVNQAILKEKISKGLPAWAIAQIKEDLSKFSTIKRTDLDRYSTEYSPPNVWARFRIENGEVKIILPKIPKDIDYSKKAQLKFFKLYEGFQHHPRFKTLYHVLKYLAKNKYIPDTDFIVGVQDRVSIPNGIPSPIFAFAKDLDDPTEKDLILMPDWLNLSSTSNLRPLIRKANTLFTWENKLPILFWRGGGYDSTGFRKEIVSLSKQHPKLIDAEFVFSGSGTKFIPPEDHLKYRYLISIDGLRCSWERLIWHLHSNSLVFKHQSNQIQWFYKGIVPHIHYIPVKNEHDIFTKIAWAETHPKEANEIIEHASSFVEENLSLEDIYHYIAVLLQEYTKKLS